MKASDIATVVLVGVIGILASIWMTNFFLGNPDEEVVTFKTIENIDNNIASPDPNVFNINAINPTVEVYVGDRENDSE